MSPPPGRIGALLASGPRADVFEWNEGENPHDARVVKIYRGESSRRSALATGAVLGAVQHRHLARLAGLVDLGSRGVGVLLQRLSTTSAAEWLAARQVVSAGEAVTLLVPILLALLHLERRGLDPRLRFDTAIGLGDVLFDESGAAVVTGVRLVAASGAGAAAEVAAVEVAAAAVAEVAAVEVAAASAAEVAPVVAVAASPEFAAGMPGVARRLVRDVLSATVGGRATSRASLEALCQQEGDIDELLEMLFELDEPAPLEWPAPEPTPAPEPEPPRPPPLHPHLLDDLVPGLYAARSAAATTIADTPLLASAWRTLRQVRPRAWAAGGILAASAVAGLALLPGLGAPAVPDADVTSGPSADSAQADSTGPRDGSRPANDSLPADDGGAARTDPTQRLLEGDDADGAARELLRLRATCLTALDGDCLSAIEQPGSPLLARDLAAVDDPSRMSDLPVDLRITEVLNRLGGVVLYRARSPDGESASVLVTRTPSGWRLRTIA